MDRRRLSAALIGSALLLGAVIPAPVWAVNPPELSKVPQSVKDKRLETPVTATDGVRPTVLAASLRGASGPKQVVIRLKAEPTGAVKGAAKQKTQMGKVKAQQSAFVARAKDAAASFKELGRTQTALNAVVAQVDARVAREAVARPRGPAGSARSSTTSSTSPRPFPTSAARPCRGWARRARASPSPCSTRASTTRTRRSAARARSSPTRTPTARSSSTRRTRRSTTPTRARSSTRRPRSSAAGTSSASCGSAARAARPRRSDPDPDPVRPGRHQGGMRRVARHPRRGHHRGQERRRARRDAARGQGLLVRSAPRAPAWP